MVSIVKLWFYGIFLTDHFFWVLQGLEKYVMTKLFARTFASSHEDANTDQEISEKICLLQHFLRPEHLDIPEVFHNEASWLVLHFPFFIGVSVNYTKLDAIKSKFVNLELLQP